MSTRRRLALVSALAGSLLLAAPSPRANAIGDLQTGYWWAGASEGGDDTAPTQVPEGGLYVSSNLSGPQAISAISFNLADGETAPQLVLRVNNLQQLDDVRIKAYPTTDEWRPGDAQAWSERPQYDENASPSNGVVSGDGTTVTFDVVGVAPGQRINLVIVPGMVDPAAPTAAVAPYPTFDISFEKPELTDVKTRRVDPRPPTTEIAPSTPPGPPLVADTAPVPMAPSLNIAPSAAKVTGLPRITTPTDPLAPPAPTASTPERAASPAQASTPVELAGTSRSALDTWLLALTLLGVVGFLAWQAHRAHLLPSTHPARVSIYDPSPAAVTDRPA